MLKKLNRESVDFEARLILNPPYQSRRWLHCTCPCLLYAPLMHSEAFFNKDCVYISFGAFGSRHKPCRTRADYNICFHIILTVFNLIYELFFGKFGKLLRFFSPIFISRIALLGFLLKLGADFQELFIRRIAV